jgi:hypothetical protein
MVNGLMDSSVDSRDGTMRHENLPLLMPQRDEEDHHEIYHSSSTTEPHSPNVHLAQHLLLSHDDDDTALYSTTPMMTHAHFIVPSSFPNHRGSLFLPTTTRSASPLQHNHRRQRSQSWGGHPAVWDATDLDDDIEVRPAWSWLYVPSLRPETDGIPAPVAADMVAPELTMQVAKPRPLDHPSVTVSASTASSDPASPRRVSTKEPTNSVGICILYGIINATIVIPVILSFATIIYRDPIFAPYLHSLIQLTLFSSIIHQLVFSACSTLPFAIGQVQDAGLIFLSNMATTIVQFYSALDDDENNVDPDRRRMGLLATTTFALSLATALLGLSLMTIGHFRLAQYVQLLPTWYVCEPCRNGHRFVFQLSHLFVILLNCIGVVVASLVVI